MLEELERAVAVAKDRVGEEQGGRTPAKLSKEGAVKTGGAAEGRKGRTTPKKGGKSVKIDEKVLPEIRKTVTGEGARRRQGVPGGGLHRRRESYWRQGQGGG